MPNQEKAQDSFHLPMRRYIEWKGTKDVTDDSGETRDESPDTQQDNSKKVYGRDAFEKELAASARSHPDRSRRHLYEAYYQLIAEQNEAFLNFIVPFLLKLKKKEMSITHFLNLLVHTHLGEYHFLIDQFRISGQRVMSSGNSGKHYADFSTADWKIVVQQFLNQETTFSVDGVQVQPAVEAAEELREQHTQTFQISRYFGLLLFLHKIGLTSELKIADVGCSLGIALNMMRSGLTIPESSLIGINAGALTLDLQYSDPHAYDIEDIRDPEMIRWIFACCAYPGESLTTFQQLREDYNKHQPSEGDGVTYHTGSEGDMMNLNQLGDNALDVITVNTTLYQLTQDKVRQFLEIACKTLRPNGWIVVTDFVHIENNGLVFADSWFNTNGEKAKRTYRTVVAQKMESGELSPWYEIFQYDNARCGSIFPGEDYNLIG